MKYDKDYETVRDKLIPIAEKYANKEAGKMPDISAYRKGKTISDQGIAIKAEWERKWNGLFHRKMNRLAEQARLPGCDYGYLTAK